MLDFIIRLKNSINIIYTSLRYMFKHKRLVFFPVLNTILITPLFIILLKAFDIGLSKKGFIGFYHFIAILIIIYILSSIIKAFTNVCLSHNLLKILENKPESFFHSLKIGFSKLNIITQWATLYSIMHYSLSVIMIPHEHEKDKEKNKNDNAITTLEKISEFSWELTTFLIYPVIAHENVHITTLYKHCIDLLKKKFGEKIIAKFSFSVINFLLISLILIILAIILPVLIDLLLPKWPINIIEKIYLSVIILSIFIYSLINSAQTIFKACVYSYTKDQDSSPDLRSFSEVGPFSRELINKFLI